MNLSIELVQLVCHIYLSYHLMAHPCSCVIKLKPTQKKYRISELILGSARYSRVTKEKLERRTGGPERIGF